MLEPYGGDEPVRFEIPTTDGRPLPLGGRAGVFHFVLVGSPQRLTAYRMTNADAEAGERLFVPFLDATSGTETYGAGRYLDLEPDEDGTYVPRLQPRLPPVVRLRPVLLVPAHAGREPPGLADRGGRAARVRLTELPAETLLRQGPRSSPARPLMEVGRWD